MRDTDAISAPTIEPPHNIELEQALLGALLIDNSTLFRVASVVRHADFYDAVHASIFEVIAKTVRENRAATPVTIKGSFEGQRVNDDLTVAQYLGRLASHATTTNAYDYALAVSELADRRRMQVLSTQMMADAHDPTQSVVELAGAAIKDLDDMLANSRARKPTRIGLGEAMEDAVNAMADDDGSSRVKSGLVSFDDVTGGGWHRKQYAVLAGRPSMGKSAVITSAMLRTAKTGTGVLLISLEMSARSLAARCISDLSWSTRQQIPYSKGMSNRLTQQEIDVWARTALSFADLPVTIDDQPNLTIAEIGARIRAEKARMQRKGVSLGLVVVDHLGLVRASSRYSGDKTNETGEVSSGLAALAKDNDVALVALCQLNRGVEGRDSKRPGLSDLRNSGDIEQDADLVAFVYRDAYYLERLKFDPGSQQEIQREAELEAKRNTLEIIIGKNRNGPTTTVPLFCDMACNVVRDLARDEPALSQRGKLASVGPDD